MPNPNDPALKQQQRELGRQIEQKEQEIAAAQGRGEDVTQMQADLKALQDQMRQVHSDQKGAREANRAEDKAGRDAAKDERAAERDARKGQ